MCAPKPPDRLAAEEREDSEERRRKEWYGRIEPRPNKVKGNKYRETIEQETRILCRISSYSYDRRDEREARRTEQLSTGRNRPKQRSYRLQRAAAFIYKHE